MLACGSVRRRSPCKATVAWHLAHVQVPTQHCGPCCRQRCPSMRLMRPVQLAQSRSNLAMSLLPFWNCDRWPSLAARFLPRPGRSFACVPLRPAVWGPTLRAAGSPVQRPPASSWPRSRIPPDRLAPARACAAGPGLGGRALALPSCQEPLRRWSVSAGSNRGMLASAGLGSGGADPHRRCGVGWGGSN